MPRYLEGAAEGGADVIRARHAFYRSMADGRPIQAAGPALACGRNNSCQNAGAHSRFPQSDSTTADRPYGLIYNPVYVYGVEAFLRDAKARRRGWIDYRRSAARGGFRALPARSCGGAQFHPPRDTDDGRRPAASRSRPYLGFVYYVSITGITGAPPRNLPRLLRRWAASRRNELAGRGRLCVKNAGSLPPIAAHANGVVVGSAIVEALARLAR